MSQAALHSPFQPASWELEPPAPPGQLGDSVIAALTRPLLGSRRRPWGAVRTFLGAALTFGLLPILIWPKRFRDFVTVEQQQLWHLAEWIRVTTGDREALALRDFASRRLSPGFLVAPVVAVFAAIAGLAALGGGGGASAAGPYIILLSGAYLLHWLNVCMRAGALQSYCQRFNAIALRHGLTRVRVRGVGLGVAFLWVVGVIVAMRVGAVWAIPAMLAGVVHERYVTRVSRRMRMEFSRRARSLALEERPARQVDYPVRLREAMYPGLCANIKCGAQLPGNVNFCPRCGSRV